MTELDGQRTKYLPRSVGDRELDLVPHKASGTNLGMLSLPPLPYRSEHDVCHKALNFLSNNKH